MKTGLPRWTKLFGAAVRDFFERGIGHWGASVAFYTLFSVPPLLITVVSVLGVVLPPERLRLDLLVERASAFLNADGVQTLEVVLAEISRFEVGALAVVPTVALLLIAGTAVFANVQAALNDIWGLEHGGSPLRQVLRARLIALLAVLVIGLLFFASLLLTTATKTIEPMLRGTFLDELGAFRVLDILISGLLYWALFATIYRVLSDASISWRDVALGSFITAACLLLGRELIATFLTRSAGASAYGAAGSVVGLLLFIYYSAQLFLFGAVFTRVWAEAHGRTIGA